MKSALGLVSILVVLLIVALVAKQQLKATVLRDAGEAASAPIVGNDPAAAKNAVSQYQQQVNQVLQQGAALRASEAEAADGR